MSGQLLPAPSSGLPRLPVIQHPLSLLGDPETISLRGFSRAPSDTQSNRAPHAPEKGGLTPILAPLQLHIPEGVQIVASADPSKTRLPIFGQRADIGSRAESQVSLASSRSISISRPGTQLRTEVDELEYVFREKMRTGGYFTLRQMFKNNDPEGKAQVSRDVLLMLLTKFMGRFISSKQYHQLLFRLKLNDKAIIKFEELYAALRDPVPSGLPAWLDPVNRRQTERIMMTASQVHTQLKEKAKQRNYFHCYMVYHSRVGFLDLSNLIPQKNPEGAARILAPEFRNMLNQLGFFMEDEEFEKLWKRYDMDGSGVLKGDSFLKKLGIEFRNGSSNHIDVPEGQTRKVSKAQLERKTSLSIEKWLKDKFREGFKHMKEEFEKHDPQNIGKVEKEDFLSILEKFDLHLKKEHLNLFLARCGLENNLSGISYMDFLRNFQDRSDRGIIHKMLSNSKHKFHREGAISPASTLTAIEVKLANLFQSDFLALMATFQKIDKLERNVISQQEFQAAIESRFGLEITDEELERLLDRIPLDEDGNVRYLQFMAMFDSRRGVPSLFNEKSDDEEKIPKHLNAYSSTEDYDSRRTPKQLFKIIKNLLHKNYSAIEKEFEELDEMNSRRLTQENMYFLLKRFNINPEITLGEIRRLWQTLITNQDRTLDFLEFVRHFGFSPKSACFPNAKINPPKKGDSDFKIRSKKLNCDSDILVDRVRAKVELFWDDLKREFEELDPYHTGFVSKEEFKDILTELCVHLNEYECEMLTKKFAVNEDGCVSYVEFLQPFALRRQMWRNVNNMEAIMQGVGGEAYLSKSEAPPEALETLTARIRKQLKGEWKTLRRAFKKLDTDRSGYLSLPEFRSVLKLCNLILDEDEVFHIMSKYDQNLNGQIHYKSFLEEACKKRKKNLAMANHNVDSNVHYPH
uniref:EF-hand calcium-binding domain-containing protein 6-like n=1 Tax=Geotrypetes seraphini TaxID=260995 RepID=A0A6P8RC71_GEOSA|nr:EF-hand calcium-binding domain-containing protein 6-like [Geotrypetes seraphini]